MSLERIEMLRLTLFLAGLAFLGLAEALMPRRPLRVGKRRWPTNLGLVVIDALCVRFVLQTVTAVAAASMAAERGWGVLHLIALPTWAAILLGVLVLDFAIYLQHVMFHALPVLWRLHMVHHTDVDVDVTTGLRFHPFEILLSVLIKGGVVTLMGIPLAAVVLFEIVLNATSMFNHSNLRIPEWLDGVLRWVVVTPDMHRVHHSVHRHETNSNFGFNVPWWDRLCGTYRARPRDGHDRMVIGLTAYQDKVRQTLGWLLVLPFRGRAGEYSIRRE